MLEIKKYRFYFCPCTQDLYGDEVLKHVAEHSASGAVTNADGMEMNAIAASIIGGTMLSGGVGNIIGTFFGVLSLGTIQNIVSSAGFTDAWWAKITVAAMICLFLVIQSIVLARKKQTE